MAKTLDGCDALIDPLHLARIRAAVPVFDLQRYLSNQFCKGVDGFAQLEAEQVLTLDVLSKEAVFFVDGEAHTRTEIVRQLAGLPAQFKPETVFSRQELVEVLTADAKELVLRDEGANVRLPKDARISRVASSKVYVATPKWKEIQAVRSVIQGVRIVSRAVGLLEAPSLLSLPAPSDGAARPAQRDELSPDRERSLSDQGKAVDLAGAFVAQVVDSKREEAIDACAARLAALEDQVRGLQRQLAAVEARVAADSVLLVDD